MKLPPQDLQEIERLRDSNLNLQAYERAKPFGKFSEWEGTEAILTAAHLTYNLGAPKESSRLTARAWHRDKSNPKAVFYFAIETLQRRGPLAALIFTRRFPDFTADATLTSWWYSLRGQLHSALRDFAAAESFHDKALSANPEAAWVWTARAFSLERQDRYEEALEFARKGFELEPLRRSSVSSVAHYLTLLEFNDEALELLSGVVRKVENAWMVKELADLQSELGMHGEAYSTLQKCLELLPLLETKTGEWVYGGLSDGAYLAGDLDRSTEYAEKASNAFHTKILENLRNSPLIEKRVQLDVRFLRQHQVTCAPATLSNIARYWSKKAEHLDLVEQMCYDGTPSYKERIWADSNGWITREFTLNWEDATSLLDRGVPLTLATVYPGGGHLQAIIGYDARRRTLLIRDPYFPKIVEFMFDELLENQKSSGPRVMALVPVESGGLLAELGRPLFESEIYDLLYRVESALESHKRDEAVASLDELEGQFPDHRLTSAARWTISGYDRHTLGIRSALHKLLEQFPTDVSLRLSDLSVSSEFTGRTERIKTLEQYALSKPTDPLIWQMFGYELGQNAKQHRRGLHWLWKSIRQSPDNALSYRLVADILWSQRRFEDAAELYRFASSLNDKDERLAYSYFLAMWNLKRADEAIDVLSDRVERFGKQSGMPVRSLFSALCEVGRENEAFAALEKALELRQDDGDLILYAAEAKARYGQTAGADELLKSAQGRASRSDWLRATARVAHLKGELDNALSNWREIIKDDPVAVDAYENAAFLIKGLEGSTAAKEYLRRACRKFPSNRSLQVLRLQHLNEEPGEAIAVLRDLIRSDPGDVWSLRELSKWYSQVGKLDRALEMAEQALGIDPNDAVTRWFRGRALEFLKRYKEAGDEYKTAIGLNVDNGYSISNWMGISRSMDAKREVLEFVWQELNKQVTNGDGLFAYRDEARRVIDRPSLLENLKEFAAANRRSWFAASAVVQQLAEIGRTDEAIELALESTRRFPLSHQTWLDLSSVYRQVGNVVGEIDALRTATSINPMWSYGVQQLADAYQRAGRFEEARDLLTGALARMPLDNYLLGYLSEIYWALGHREDAIDAAKRAVTIEPDYRWAWNAIKLWADEIGDRDLPVALARELTQKKPKDIRAWINLAEMLETGALSRDRLDAVEQALKIDPHAPAALAIKANALAEFRRFDEAIQVSQSKMPDGYRPEQLRFVEAGIEAMRGNESRSLDILVELTETSPSYTPGWLRLADVYRLDDQRQHEYRKTAMEIVRLAPREATAFGYLAEACLKLDLRADARDALEQAVILDPTYEYAVTTLFDLLIEKGDTKAAAELAETVTISSKVTGLPIAVEIAARNEDRTALLKSLRELLQNQEVSRERLDRVFEKVTGLFGKGDTLLLDLLREIAVTGKANPTVGRYLIDHIWRTEKKKGCEKALESISNQSALWARAASRFMEMLAGENPRLLMKFIDANGEKLGGDTESWGAVGYQLTNFDEFDRLSRWFIGWENRRDVMPWMLWNYSVVLRRAGKADHAGKVNSAALGLQYDDTVNLHLTTLALAQVKLEEFDEALATFTGINPQGMNDWDRFFYETLNESLWAYDRIQKGDIDAAKALIDSIVDRIIAFDAKGSDKMVTDLVRAPLKLLLNLIGDRWFAFRKKAKLLYYSLG